MIELNSLQFTIIGLFLFLLSLCLVRIFYSYAYKEGLLDIPNARSSHQGIVPRGGGIVFAGLWILCLLVIYAFHGLSFREFLFFFPAAFLISLLGFWDDYQRISAKKRLLAQIVIAFLSIIPMGGFSSFYFLSDTTTLYVGAGGILLAVLALVWSTNAFNFMDGLDGFASIEALFVFGVGGFLLWHSGAMPYAQLAWMLAILVAGFLVWNLPKARVFMGDAGSYCLGFLVALFALIGNKYYHLPVTFWIILYGAFWFDATLTVLRRLWKGENLSVAHREHAYQRLYRAGFSSWQILLGLIILNTFLSSLVLFSNVKREFLGWSLFLAIIILSLIYGMIERLKPMGKTA